jgi:D-alanine transaminase
VSARDRHPRAPAGRIAYVDGRYVPLANAYVHIEDRGLQFADGVYEGIAVAGGRLLDLDGHMKRLERSTRELSIPMPMPRGAFEIVLHETVRRNRVRDGFLYIQITRGAMKRDHAIPATAYPSLIVTVRPVDQVGFNRRAAEGIAVTTEPDIRWGRCDIKTTGLTANILAKTAGRAKGAYEVWLVDRDGMVTEGSSTTAWIVTTDGRILTRDLKSNILPGVTRASLIRALAGAGANTKLEERAFSVADAKAAQEAFITAASAWAVPVITIDGARVGDGKPGPVTRRLQALYREAAMANAAS